MTERELIDLCLQTEAVRSRNILYWTAEIYGFGKHIREYGFYPRFLPLCVYTDHGPGQLDDRPYLHELTSGAPCQMYHSPASVEIWKKFSSNTCYVLYSPFVFYRRSCKIEKSKNAKGTIAFPAHSTPMIDDVSDVELYIKQLLELPDRFQPVSVCLYMQDINKGRHKIFMKHKIPVVTAGCTLDLRFTQRFYDILKNFLFATSNSIGSYVYYAVEMGIPFSLYGNKQVYINTGDPNIPYGEWDPYKESKSYRMMSDLFSGLQTEITQEQKEVVETTLGLKDGIGRIKMSFVLYSSFLKWALNKRKLSS